MNSVLASSLLNHCENLEDPRDHRARRHELRNVIFIALSAVTGGADSWTDVEMFGKSKREWFESLLDLPNGIPSHDTFGRVFSMLNPEKFQECFSEWMATISEMTKGDVVAIDGKTLRRSGDADIPPIHMVSAWAKSNKMILGQLKVDERSNEITAIPKLLDMLDVSESTVTIDAIGCQKEVAEKIIEQKADYVLALKKNQPSLYDDVVEIFDDERETKIDGRSPNFVETVDKGHGRIETRRCRTVNDPDHIAYLNDAGEWSKLASVAMVESERLTGGERSIETRYFISSLSGDAESMLECVRAHWGIENSVHWVLDVTFGEDYCLVRKGNAAQNFSTMRRMALNMLKREATLKASIAGKRKRAGWDEKYLLKVLMGSAR